jgi:hypothetical protein
MVVTPEEVERYRDTHCLGSCHFSEVSSPEESRQSSRQFIGKLAQLHEC